MRGTIYRSVALFAALCILVLARSFTQPAPVPAGAEATVFNTEQLDALLAPIAFYPDALLAQGSGADVRCRLLMHAGGSMFPQTRV
jgi:hypothetical protein